MKDPKREQKDAVTIGMIRRRYEATLERQIKELSGLIREGYHARPKSEAFLKDYIGKTLTELHNIDAMAGTELIFPLAAMESKRSEA